MRYNPKRDIKISYNKDGSVNARCRKRLWSVTAPTKEQALTEALHYYQQYLSDGEYDD